MKKNLTTLFTAILYFLHKTKIVEGFLGKTKPSTAMYSNVHEERRQVLTTKSPTRLTYAGSLLIFVISNAQAQEFKIGITQHDFDTKLNHRVEKGQNIIIEYLFDKLDNYLRAYPHIGASINSKGYTSNLYTGVTWQADFDNTFLVEVSLGISLNNAERKISKKRRGLGSNLLFRESLSLGYKLSQIH